MNTIDKLVPMIEDWGIAKNLHGLENTVPQSVKTIEECSELCTAIVTHNEEETIDAIGDILITVIIQSIRRGFDFVNVYNEAGGISDVNVDLIDEQPFQLVTHANKCMFYAVSLSNNCVLDNEGMIKDSISRIIVSLMTISHLTSLSMHVCLQSAWDVIKDRKGKTVNGMFIKD